MRFLLFAIALLASSSYVIIAEEFFIGFMAAVTDKQSGSDIGVGNPTAAGVFGAFMHTFNNPDPGQEFLDGGHFRDRGKLIISHHLLTLLI